jgi:hypothetical protein
MADRESWELMCVRMTWLLIGAGLVLALCLIGCAGGPLKPRLVTGPAFRDLYRSAMTAGQEKTTADAGGKRISVVSEAMTVGDFARLIATEADVSVVVEEALDPRLVSVDVRNETVDSVLGIVARRLGVEMSRSGSLYFLGAIKPEDKAVLVRRVTRLKADQIRQAIATVATESANTVVDDDGLCIVSDRIEVLRRVHEMIDAINAAATRTWVVQVYLVGLSRRAVDDLGIQLDPSLRVGAAVNLPGQSGISLEAALDAVLQYEQLRSDVLTLASPTFVVRDGVPSRVFVGDTIPVPRRAISDAGTSTVQGFDQVEAGLSVECEVREAGSAEAILRLAIERSRIKGTVEGAPIKGSENFDTSAVVGRRGVYMLGELVRSDGESTEGGNFRFGHREADSCDVVQIWARVDTVGSDITGRRDLVAAPAASVPTPAYTPASPVQREASPAAMSDSKTMVREADSVTGESNLGVSKARSPSNPVSGEPGPKLISPAPTNVRHSGGWQSVPTWPPGGK